MIASEVEIGEEKLISWTLNALCVNLGLTSIREYTVLQRRDVVYKPDIIVVLIFSFLTFLTILGALLLVLMRVI